MQSQNHIVDPSVQLEEAARLHRAGALGEAAARYLHVLNHHPANVTALYNLARIRCQQGQFGEGADLARRALAADPRHARSHVLLGRVLAESGEVQDALASFDRAIACEGGHADAHGNRGDVLAQLGRLEEAVESYRHAIAIEPSSLANWCNLGAAQADLGRDEEALASYARALAIQPGYVDAHLNQGRLLTRLGRPEDALASLQRGLALSPDHVPALVSCGDALRALERPADALAQYDRALAIAPHEISALRGRISVLLALKRPQEALATLDCALELAPSDADALSNRGFVLQMLARHEEARATLDRALQIDPNHTEALVNLGVSLSELGRHHGALASYDRAVAVSPGHVLAHCNRSKALFALDRYDEALAGIERALAINPGHVEAVYTRGLALAKLLRYDEAIESFERVLELAPAHPHALAQVAASCLATCAWDKAAVVAGRLYKALAAGTAVVAPHILLQLSAPPDVVLAATKQYVARELPAGPRLEPAATPRSGDKIKVAYLSGDFREHPVGYLTAELFERHDRSRFETIGVSIGPDDKSELRSRLVRSFDRFHDFQTASDREVAAFIRSLGVDVVVDLGGYTNRSRPGVLRYRPAPVQVNYLGYAGTMGADFVDYIVADKVALPFEQQPFYSERIVHLPDCFMVNDATKAISPVSPSRAEEGLPERGFVFACFNNAYKISAEAFHVWMRLLTEVDGSVLWLSQFDKAAGDNLRAAARATGVDPQRIIFALRKPEMADHFARQRLADLFVDTPGYNAHTTASDALWAGLPVLTCMGTMFPGRVAASLLHAVGLPELVTDSLDSYAAFALTLARDPPLLAGIRQRLAQNRLTYPLFDTDRFRRHIEQAYVTMLENHRQGIGPRSFSVAPIDTAN